MNTLKIHYRYRDEIVHDVKSLEHASELFDNIANRNAAAGGYLTNRDAELLFEGELYRLSPACRVGGGTWERVAPIVLDYELTPHEEAVEEYWQAQREASN